MWLCNSIQFSLIEQLPCTGSFTGSSRGNRNARRLLSVLTESVVQRQGAGAKVDERGGGLFPTQSVADGPGAAVDRRGGEKRSWFWLANWGWVLKDG